MRRTLTGQAWSSWRKGKLHNYNNQSDYSVKSLPILPNLVIDENELERWPHLKGLEIPRIKNGEVMLLIGIDNPEIFWTAMVRKASHT